MEYNFASFGQWVRRRRRLLDLTQAELAQAAYCSVAMIKKIESDERGASASLAHQLARVLLIPEQYADVFVRIAAYEISVSALPNPHSLADDREQPTHLSSRIHLPYQPTRFIGREAAIDTISAMLHSPHVRLITLIGPPGIGKTRLAIASANNVKHAFPGGIAFIDLSATLSEAEIVPKVAHAFGLNIDGQQSVLPILQRLHRRFDNCATLVIIDNCEHLSHAAGVISEILSVVLHLKIIATSREALRLRAEQRVEVRPLSMPPAMHGLFGAIDISSYEAIRLFLDRAQAVRYEFSLTDANATAVARICHILDGLPLAIELAAARIASLSIDAIAQTLAADQPGTLLDLLNLSSYDQPARHQTLRHAIMWSYEMLSLPAQSLFRLLAIFHRGWTLEAALTIAQTRDIVNPQLTTDLLSELVHKNLIQTLPQSDGTFRYSMLVMLRDFGREMLRSMQEEEHAKEQHANYFYTSVIQLQSQSCTQQQWLHWIESDYENIRITLRYLRDKNDSQRTLYMSMALAEFWRTRGMLAEGYTWLHNALLNSLPPQDHTSNGTHARAWALAGDLCYHQSDLQRAQHHYQQGLALLNPEHQELLAMLYCRLGRCSPYPEALPLLQQSLAIYQTLGDCTGQAQLLSNIASIEHFQGHYERSITYKLQAIDLYKQEGKDALALAEVQTELAQTLLQIGRIDEARRYQKDNITILRSMNGPQLQLGWDLLSMGAIASAQSEFAEARTLLFESLAIFEEIGDRSGIQWCYYDLGRTELRAGNLADAEQWLEQSNGVFLLEHDPFNNIWVHTLLAEVELRRHHVQSTKNHLLAALAPARTAHSVSYALTTCSALISQQHCFEQAAVLLGAADGLRKSYSTPLPPADYEPYMLLMFSLQSQLSIEQYNQAYMQGQMLSLDEAICHAQGMLI